MRLIDKLNFFFFVIIFLGLFVIDIKIVGINFTTFIVFIPLIINFKERAFKHVNFKLSLRFFTLFYLSYSLILLFIHNTGFSSYMSAVSPFLYALCAVSLNDSFLNPIFLKKIIFFLKIVFMVFFISFIATYDSSENGLVYVFKFSHRTVLGYFFLYLFLIIYSVEKNNKTKIILTILILLEIIINSSRGPFVFIVWFIIYRLFKQYGSKSILILVFCGSIFFFLFKNFYLDSSNPILNMTERVSTIYDTSKSSSSKYRISVFNSSLVYGFFNPLGGGIDGFRNEFKNYTDLNLTYAEDYVTDNTFSKVLYETGFIPLFFILGFIISSFFVKNSVLSASIALVVIHFFMDDALNSLLFISFILITVANCLKSKFIYENSILFPYRRF